MLHLEARPRPVANALNLAALHREADFRRAIVAGDDLELRAEQFVVKARRDFRIDIRLAADNELLVEQILRRLEWRRGQREGDSRLAVEVAQPVELVEVEMHLPGHGQLGEQHATLDEANGQAIARRGVVEQIGGDHAAGGGHVLHDDGGRARQMLA